MVRLCSECGVALTIVQDLPDTYTCGAIIWRGNKAILALSVRGKRADIFWFTFFHELAHLINHLNKEFHINYFNDEIECILAGRLLHDELIEYTKYSDLRLSFKIVCSNNR